ncbi:hypothetical protein M5J15_16380 (plasmid) [Serratia symbiotica]|uniref:hypothetical protein n=1 Tax=Serratia symbiotica TaxID=138074 RepID=UPI00209012E9|nr:hypothetical protein [Serratia symbiotica]USS96898.1 hypothetical protein M5J15_16675 [Serratia symbiotica]USS96924.1 hypothetical protein M5J15_16380 [Serratia symbiotica]
MNDTSIKRQRSRPRTGNALSAAERARRYRENKKIRQAEHPQPSRAELLAELEAANNHIRQLEAKIALLVTENDDSIKTWSM